MRNVSRTYSRTRNSSSRVNLFADPVDTRGEEEEEEGMENALTKKRHRTKHTKEKKCNVSARNQEMGLWHT